MSECISTSGEKKILIILVLYLKFVLVWGLRKQSLRQKIICYNIIRECNCRQTQEKEKSKHGRRKESQYEGENRLLLGIKNNCLLNAVDFSVEFCMNYGFQGHFFKRVKKEEFAFHLLYFPLIKVYSVLLLVTA